MTEEGATRTIYAIAQSRDDVSEARKALRNFEDNWWLQNLSKSAGRIAFDYDTLK
jgi:hypothetical protein